MSLSDVGGHHSLSLLHKCGFMSWNPLHIMWDHHSLIHLLHSWCSSTPLLESTHLPPLPSQFHRWMERALTSHLKNQWDHCHRGTRALVVEHIGWKCSSSSSHWKSGSEEWWCWCDHESSRKGTIYLHIIYIYNTYKHYYYFNTINKYNQYQYKDLIHLNWKYYYIHISSNTCISNINYISDCNIVY